MEDKDLRATILLDDGNVLVIAGAGSGKTTILTSKIKTDLDKNISHYKIAAITFTRKAAKEIKYKLKRATTDNFIGTNDSFAEQEIIKPFIKDALGNNYPNEFEVVYNVKFNTFEEGLALLENSSKLGVYYNTKRNFKFELALRILRSSRVAREYIQARYYRIFVDEYQDCDKDMHALFMYIKDELKIKFFIVGDPKQSIYQWRGAEPKYLQGLNSDNNNEFHKYELTENFRCCIDIQNYSNVLVNENCRLYQEVDYAKDVIGIKNSPYNFLKYLNLDKEIAVLVRTNIDAKTIEKQLNSIGLNFVFIPRTPLDDVGTQNSSLLIELAKYAKDEKYTKYDLVNELPIVFSKSEINEIEDSLKPIKEKVYKEGEIEKALKGFFNIIQNSSLDNAEIMAFKNTIMSNEYDNAFNGKEYSHKILTIHSSKGLEFDQVVIFAKDYMLNGGKDQNEHYVSATRGKEKLVILLVESYYKHLVAVANKCGFNSLEKLIRII